MGGVTLTDQMGAMAVIDDLRHRTLVVKDHLNLRERREEAAGNIRAYYKAKGVEVDGDLVERGVREYFDRRLTFDGRRLNPITEKLAKLYITRERWGKPVGIGLGIVTAVAIAVSSAVTMIRDGHVKDLQTIANRAIMDRDRLVAKASNLSNRFGVLAKESSNADVSSGVRIAYTAKEALAKVPAMLPTDMVSKVTLGTIDADRGMVNDELALIQNAEQVVQGATRTEAEMRELLEANARLRDLESSKEFESAAAQFPQLAESGRQAHEAIAQADTAGVRAASAAVGSTIGMLSSVGKISELVKTANAISKEFAAMSLSKDERGTINAVVAATNAAIDRIDLADAQRNIEAMRQLLAYAKTAITLNITDRKGVKSGVERNYDASGGKTWYLIVDATDAAGKLISVPVKNSENGKSTYTATFGVGVTEDEYKKARAEKMKDGHIRDRAMGAKSEGSLTIKFNQRTTAKPDTITAW